MGRVYAVLFVGLVLAAGCTQPREPPATSNPASTGSITSHPPSDATQSLVPRAEPDLHRVDPELPTDGEKTSLPACGQTLFGTPPVDLGLVTSITPIGNLAPPGHTFPTDHPFLHLWPGDSRTDIVGAAAPGNLTVLLLTSNTGATQDPVDYTIWFAACRDVVAYLNHVKSLAPELQALYDAGSCRFPGESKTTRCNIFTFHPVEQGEVLGGVGGRQGNFDFGAIDLRVTHTFANPTRYSTRTLHIQCALDYYAEPLRGQFYAKLERQGAGACGSNAVDVPGTLQGNWVHSTTQDPVSEWTKHLAFAPDNVDPGLGVVSVAGQVHDAATMRFSPQSEGTVNRRFADVTSDGHVYCYEGTGVTGRFLVELTNASALRIQHVDGACADGGTLSSAQAYLR